MTPVAAPACAVSYGVPRAGVPAAVSFEKWVAAALTHVRSREFGECAIRIVGTVEGRALNRVWRQRDYATNVLSFPSASPAPVASAWLGDIALCATVIAREARVQRKRTRDHYAHLTVHGVLHLLGFDHEDPADARAMERLEREVLRGLGIPDPYR